MLLECVRRGRAGMTWNSEFGFSTYLPACFFWFVGFCCCLGAYEVGIGDREAIGVFLFATGSVMDEMLGVSPAGSVVEMGGVNGTGDAVTMMNGTGDAVMEDVEVAKSRRVFRKELVS